VNHNDNIIHQFVDSC